MEMKKRRRYTRYKSETVTLRGNEKPEKLFSDDLSPATTLASSSTEIVAAPSRV